MAKNEEVRGLLRELSETAPVGFAAMCRGVCPHSFGMRDTMRGKCREWDGCFEPPFCTACWKEAIAE